MRLVYKLTLATGLMVWLIPTQAEAVTRRQMRHSPQLTARVKSGVGSKELIARLERRIPQLMKEGEVPGLSAAVISNGSVLWQRGFGVMNAATGQPVIEGTVFEAASLSKPVFAYAILKLADQGKIDLDTPLVKYLPGAYVKNDERLNSITTRMVLSHTTGFQNWRSQAHPLKIHFDPGIKFSYSGEGFVYLQKVVEHLTAQPLELLMQREVFEPLGMVNSSYIWIDKYEALKAYPHTTSGTVNNRRKPTVPNPASSLHTTTEDYARFVIAIMKGAGLKRETLRQMLSPQAEVDEGCFNCINNPGTGRLSRSIFWGLGWGLQQTVDGNTFWHWGDNNGDTHCYVVASQKRRTGVVIFTNSGNGHSIIPEIVTQVMGDKQPAVAWLNYEPYNSPAKTLMRAILSDGADVPLRKYMEERRRGTKRLNEDQVNRIGQELLRRNKINEAIAVFRLNVADFPESYAVYDSLGEAYLAKGNKALAIENYQKSVGLNPNNLKGVQRLKKLRE